MRTLNEMHVLRMPRIKAAPETKLSQYAWHLKQNLHDANGDNSTIKTLFFQGTPRLSTENLSGLNITYE